MNHGSLPTTSFRDLHHGDSPLLPPNAWDMASAVASAEAGFRAPALRRRARSSPSPSTS